VFSTEPHRNYRWFLALISLMPVAVWGDHKPAAQGSSVVDIVVLKSGRTLRGLIARQDPKASLLLIVSRPWFVNANPTAATTAIKENTDAQRLGWTQTRQRIVERQKVGEQPPGMVFFLDQELQRLDRLLDDPPPTELEFLWIEIRPAAISKVTRASDERRQIAAHAWNAKLPNVETTDATSLRKELLAQGVNPDLPSHDFTDHLPVRLQSDQEWAARLALVEHTLIEPLNFQGMGDVLTRVSDGQAASLSDVIPQLLQQQFQSLLKELSLENPPVEKSKSQSAWLTNAIRQAEKLHRRGFRVTRLELDAAGSRVRVESKFIARVAENQWRTLWTMTEVEDGTKARPQAEARIEEDPQLKALKESLDSLGLIDAESLRKAVRFGAATMSAQQRVDNAFETFRETYTRSLDRPPLQLFSTTAGDAE